MKFNETKSQELLINLMLQTGAEWPALGEFAAQDKNGWVFVYDEEPFRSGDEWRPDCVHEGFLIKAPTLPSWHQTIITREQYEARDGWITWHGGECPVDGAVVEVKLNGGEPKWGGVGAAKEWEWQHDDMEEDIIAYRIHKPSQQEPCESVKACIPDQPTIEKLIAEWRQAQMNQYDELHNLNKQQAVYDAARSVTDVAHKRVQDKLTELGWQAVTQPEPSQPVITDWRDLRVGDVVEITNSDHSAWLRFAGEEMFVMSTGDSADELLLEDHFGDKWAVSDNTDWKFIRRP